MQDARALTALWRNQTILTVHFGHDEAQIGSIIVPVTHEMEIAALLIASRLFEMRQHLCKQMLDYMLALR